MSSVCVFVCLFFYKYCVIADCDVKDKSHITCVSFTVYFVVSYFSYFYSYAKNQKK